jgi:hypothetical protein
LPSVFKMVKTEPEEKLLLTSDLTTEERRLVLLKRSTAAKKSILKKDEVQASEKESLVSSGSPITHSKSSAMKSATEEDLLLTHQRYTFPEINFNNLISGSDVPYGYVEINQVGPGALPYKPLDPLTVYLKRDLTQLERPVILVIPEAGCYLCAPKEGALFPLGGPSSDAYWTAILSVTGQEASYFYPYVVTVAHMKRKLRKSSGQSKEYHAFRSRFQAREEGTFHFVTLCLANNDKKSPRPLQLQEEGKPREEDQPPTYAEHHEVVRNQCI